MKLVVLSLRAEFDLIFDSDPDLVYFFNFQAALPVSQIFSCGSVLLYY